MKKTTSLLMALFLSSGLLFGCYSTPEEQPDTSTESAETEPVAVETVAPGTTTIDIQNFAFGPKTTSVSVGTTVIWSNNDSPPHTVTTTSAPESFDSKTLNTGETFSMTFNTPGTYEYMCTIHPSMRGTIVVSE